MTVTIAGISELGVERGSINGSAITGMTINVGGGTNSIWTRPYLQMISSDEETFVSLSVANVVTDKGTLPGPFTPGVFAKNVKQFDVRFETNNCVARAIVTTFFFG